MLKSVLELVGWAVCRLEGGLGRVGVGPRYVSASQKFDKTGVTSWMAGDHLNDYGGGACTLRYRSFAHRLWRSQEATLLRRTLPGCPENVLDFGCGDGAFSLAALGRLKWGFDVDPLVARQAASAGAYESVLANPGGKIPLPDQSVGTALSNSVLEHTEDLAAALLELARVLVPQGRVVLTVPTTGFTRQLEKLGGREFAARVNLRFFHRNLFSAEDWREKVESVGLSIVHIQSYQELSTSATYMALRLLGPRLTGRVPHTVVRWFERGLEPVLRDIVMSETGKEGIRENDANVFIVAVKRG